MERNLLEAVLFDHGEIIVFHQNVFFRGGADICLRIIYKTVAGLSAVIACHRHGGIVHIDSGEVFFLLRRQSAKILIQAVFVHIAASSIFLRSLQKRLFFHGPARKNFLLSL